jgi:hypothetical protein
LYICTKYNFYNMKTKIQIRNKCILLSAFLTIISLTSLIFIKNNNYFQYIALFDVISIMVVNLYYFIKYRKIIFDN